MPVGRRQQTKHTRNDKARSWKLLQVAELRTAVSAIVAAVMKMHSFEALCLKNTNRNALCFQLQTKLRTIYTQNQKKITISDLWILLDSVLLEFLIYCIFQGFVQCFCKRLHGTTKVITANHRYSPFLQCTALPHDRQKLYIITFN